MNISSILPASKKLFCSLGVVGVLLAAFVSPVFSQQAPQYSQNASLKLSPQSLQQLMAPIALYPDALIALILPASTVPSDVVLASRYVAGNGDPLQFSNQPWDNSVQSLASYPDVLTWMDQNLEWTTSVGQAFIVQPGDVMSAIQQLRLQAATAGNLVDTPQQVIVKEKTYIRIISAEPQYLYVPQYDPEIVYVQPYSQDFGPLVTFGLGFAVGAWLNYDFDWNRQQIYRGDWEPGWDYDRYDNGGNGGGNNVVNVVNINNTTAQVWEPSSNSLQQVERQQQNFNRSASNAGVNAQSSTDATAAKVNQTDRILRDVPKPSRADFGKRGSGNRNAAAATAPRAAGETTMPPDVVGQQGKPLRNEKKREQDKANALRPSSTPVQVPLNSAPNQIGSVPATTPSKKEQRAAEAAITERMPQTTQAPGVDQNGRAPSVTTEPAPDGKRNGKPRQNSPSQAPPAPVAKEQPSNPPPVKNSDRKNTSPERLKTPPSQKAQPSQPPQYNQPPSKPNIERKEQKSAPAPQQQPQRKQQPQQQTQEQRPQPQKPQEQKQKPQQQRQEQRPQQQPQPQEQKQKPEQQRQEQKPQQKEQKSAPPQDSSDNKKSDKKDKKD